MNSFVHRQLFIWGTICVWVSLATIFVVIGPDRIGQAFYDLAHKINQLPFGWLIIAGLLVIESFPPVMGHTTTVTLCGYAYGMKGFYIAAGGSLAGACFAFAVLRLLFRERLRRWSASNQKWIALETVVGAKGLPLITLVRASPFPPWGWAHAMFASVDTVALWQFFLASFVLFPKFALFVLIGSRLAALSDGDQRSHMDTSTKILNVAISVGGILLSTTAGWIIYRAMQAEVRRLQEMTPEVDELSTEGTDDAAEEAPLLGQYAPSLSSET
ncbi:Golgi apparatus membrane protein TVP38 [Sparassis latifolia]